jgi:hypothetical protein
VLGRSSASKSMSGMRRSKPTALCVSERESATAMSALIRPSLRAATAIRVWQRASIEWMAAVLAAEPTAMPRSISRQVALWTDELELFRGASELAGGVHELGAGGVAAGAAVVDGRVPVSEPDEQDCVDRFGGFGVSEPDRLAAFLATGAHPLGEPAERVAVVDDDGLDEQMLAGEEELTT